MTQNVYIQKEDVERILNAVRPIGDNGEPLQIRSLRPYQTAFAHKSVVHDPVVSKSTNASVSNEVLEFLGDSFIGATVAKYLHQRFDDQQEGFLTKTRTVLVRSNMLYRFARFLGLGKYILLSSHVDRLTSMGSNKGRNNPRLYEDTFEALVGAIIQDFEDPMDPVAGSRYAYRFIISIIEHIVDFGEIIMNNENFKDTLQRYFQSLKWTNPIYIDLHETGPSHTRVFTKGVFLKREYTDQLRPEIRERVCQYHEEQVSKNIPSVIDIIKAYAKETDSYIIGIAEANKKAVAEQNCCSVALCCLKVNYNWTGARSS